MAGKPNKTQPTQIAVEAFLAKVTPEARRADSVRLCEFMTHAAGETPQMWGPGIVGFGVRHYRTEAGREGDICAIGFSPRKQALVLYVTGAAENDPLVARLGKVTTGKSCIYLKSLADIDLAVLEAIIARTLAKP